MIQFFRAPPPLPSARREPTPAPAAPPPPPKPVEVPQKNVSTFEGAKPPNLTVASTLRTEQLGDGRANCLEKAVGLARPGDSIILLSDSKDGVGHALVRKPDGSVVDPNHPEVRYETLGQWQAMHPRYGQPVSVPAGQVKQVLSTPPGEKRDALLQQLGLSGVANRKVADEERWVTPTGAVNVRASEDTGSRLVGGQQLGDKMQVLGQNAEGTRLQVKLQDGTVGWVSAEAVDDTQAPQPPRFADWLVQGTRPPDMDSNVWKLMGPQGQEQFIRAEREKAVAKDWPQPDFDVNGPPPPSIDMLSWSHMPNDARQVVFQQQWQAAVSEQTSLLFNNTGVPQGGVRVENPFLGVDSSLGRGKVGQWLLFTANPVPESAAQYFDLRKVFGDGWKIHNNLCGPLAAGASLGMSPQESLTTFKSSAGDDALKSGWTTDNSQLEGMYVEAGWTTQYKPGKRPPEDVARLITEGHELLALVNINTATENGMLRPYDDSSDKTRVAHWVDVLSVEETASGDWMVRVYNPYENREEVYPWDEFEASWSNTAAKSGGTYTPNSPYAVIIATPPPEQ